MFRGLVENAPDVLICVDRDGTIVLVNAQTERLFGFRRDELIGRPVEILVPEHERQVHRHHRDRYGRHPRPWPMHVGMRLRARRKDGTVFPAEISLAPMAEGPDPLVTAAIRDVTDRVEIEAELQRRVDEHERVNRNLEAFTYSVSHDLRAPLRVLSGFSAALLEEYGDTLGETGRGYAERIEAASRGMGRLIDDLLALSRLSQAVLRFETLDLGAEIAAIARELEESEPDRRSCFVIAPDVLVEADRTLIHTVLENLLGNAWKFTAGRAEARIEFGTLPVGTMAGGGAFVCYFVRDNGIGFDSAYAGKLFEPFQRLHAEQEFEGSGVGLASVKRIIDLHRGKVWAEGSVGHGASFYFTLGGSASV